MSDDGITARLFSWVNSMTGGPRAVAVIRDSRTHEERRADKLRWRIRRAAARAAMMKNRGWWP